MNIPQDKLINAYRAFLIKNTDTTPGKEDDSREHYHRQLGMFTEFTAWLYTSQSEAVKNIIPQHDYIGVIKEMIGTIELFLILTENSTGLHGWHLNGDIAEWGLWQEEIDTAEQALEKAKTILEAR